MAVETIDHGKWFREQIEEAVREADNPDTEWVPHEAVKEDMARQRAILMERINRSRG